MVIVPFLLKVQTISYHYSFQFLSNPVKNFFGVQTRLQDAGVLKERFNALLGPMSIIHVHQFNLFLLINVVELGIWVDSAWESLVYTKGQVPTAVYTHKHDVFVTGVTWLKLKSFHKLVVDLVPRFVKLQKHRIFIFVVQIIEYLIFSLKLYNFMVLKFYIFFRSFVYC